MDPPIIWPNSKADFATGGGGDPTAVPLAQCWSRNSGSGGARPIGSAVRIPGLKLAREKLLAP
ncbi:hypothetical protein GGTG_10699 [Gaeumannomyces tritici R3-111a-1]|uniref:Uncharacterized protein n=1 Tax=Gaeumannomyces tritici (strain R3-111a-1) TaxID=644352 RepID=J3PB25_GAET3|nr:hypothetical protein GGTG_10699 [Gaeumannomyces tritici R3-111a-1]EJT71441.1 hypothetical protein GGTG_10699 [Gaeumannomyces tritici R3-111a-1]